MKEKTAKMKRCAAGEHIPSERAMELVEAALDFDASDEFVSGIAFACAFLACKKDDPRFGMDPAEFYAHGPVLEEPPAEVMDAARKVIEQLKANGIHVVECQIVRSDR